MRSPCSRKSSKSSRLGQGMTEYIIIVGLIAIFLILAVRSFGKEIDTAIQGTDGNGGAVRGVRDVGVAIDNPSGTTLGNGVDPRNGGNGSGDDGVEEPPTLPENNNALEGARRVLSDTNPAIGRNPGSGN